MPHASGCSACGFSNPRVFRACARCGVLVSDASRRTGTRSGNTVGRMRLAPEGTVPRATTPVFVSHEVTAGRGDEHEPALVGRASVVALLARGIERAFAFGAPTVVAIEGPRGAGKTRLLFAATQRAARLDPRVSVVYGSNREGHDDTYAPFSRILLDRFGVTPSSGPSQVRDEMTTTVTDALDGAGAATVNETTHLLGHVAGVPFPDSPILRSLESHGDELHRRSVDALRRLFVADARRAPVLLLLDDVHAADPAAWDVIRDLCRIEASIAIVLTGEAGIVERARGLTPLGGVSATVLPPIDEADVAEIVRGLLPELKVVPEELVAALAHRSNGIPSALRELVFALWESGVFLRTGEHLEVDVARLDDADMPVSMQDAVRARLARLDALERAVLERAAIVGEAFWDGAVLAQMRSERRAPGATKTPLAIWADDTDADEVDSALERLVERGFVVASGVAAAAGVREYRFAIAGTRQLVHDETELETRMRRHGVVARFLSVLSVARRDRLGELVAPHYELAGNRTRAAQAYFEAAILERKERRAARALAYAEKALANLDDEEAALRLDVLHEQGSLLTTVGQYDRANESFGEMLRLAWAIGARGKGGAALNRIARVHRLRGEDAKAREVLARALELFRSADDLRGVASSLDDLAQIELHDGRTTEATRAVVEALEIRRAHGDRRGEALSLTTLGRIELRRGRLARAEPYLRTGLEIRESVGDDEGILGSLVTLGRLLFERGERESALETWQRGLSRARELADRRSECILMQSLAEGNLVLGRLDATAELLSRSREIAREIGEMIALTRIEILFGRLAMRRGEASAKTLLENSLALAEAHGAKESMAFAHRYLGQWRALTVNDANVKRSQTAEESFLISIDYFRDVGNEREAARSLLDLGHHLLERGDVESARERLIEARAIMRRMGLPEAEHVARVLAELRS